jgi:hypothetical protein
MFAMRRILPFLGILSALFSVFCVARSETSEVKKPVNMASERGSSTVLSYEILKRYEPEPGDQPRVLHYVISLNEYIAREQMEELICEIASVEDPVQYDVFRSFFYYQLTEYRVYVMDGPAATEQAERAMGSYGWNRRLPGNPHALQLYLDLHGERLEKTLEYAFDHLKDCPGSAKD